MPANQFQRMVFAFLTVLVTVHAYAGFNLFTLLANWLKLVCYNFPFAFFTQLFFIQPLIRTIFKLLFRKNTVQSE